MKTNIEFLGTINEQKINKYTSESDNGIKFSFLNYGGVITEIITPDKFGNYENIVLNFDNYKDYEINKPFLGAIVGRVAGRIKGARFTINGTEYFLEKNNGNNSLHGGTFGFSHQIWDVSEYVDDENATFKLIHFSKDGKDGFPGNISMEVTYNLSKEGELIINYKGSSDKDTILNPTNHTYFNLSGNAKNTIQDHNLKIKSDTFIELNEELIPTGKLLSVENTPFDFREYKSISDGIKGNHIQNIIVGNGYDHGFIIDKDLSIYDPVSGRELKVETDSKSVVIYTSNSMDDNFKVNNRISERYLGICFETQIEPDAVNNPNFSSCVLKKGEQFSTTTKFIFSVLKS